MGSYFNRLSRLALVVSALGASTGSAPALAQTAAPSIPQSCQMFYAGSLGLQCYRYLEDFVPNPGTDASTIAAAVPWCRELAWGSFAQGVTPPPGGYDCFQFVATERQAIEIAARLDATTMAKGELFAMLTNGLGYRQAQSASPANPMVLTASEQYRRMIYTVGATNPRFGRLYTVSLNAAVPADRYLNTDRANAVTVPMEREVNETLPTPTGSGHYFFPLAYGQKKVRLQYTLTGNMQLAFALATRTGPGTYTAQAETTIAGPRLNNMSEKLSSLPVNTSSTTQPVGVLVRITGTNPLAPQGEAYRVKVANDDAWLAQASFSNLEPISRWYPGVSGTLQIATYVRVEATVKNQAGAVQRDKEVVVTVTPNTYFINDKLSYSYRTDVNGRIVADVPFPACAGTETWRYNYTSPSTPADHWDGSAQKAIAVMSLPMADGSPGLRLTSSINITRICQELWRGRY